MYQLGHEYGIHNMYSRYLLIAMFCDFFLSNFRTNTSKNSTEHGNPISRSILLKITLLPLSSCVQVLYLGQNFK